MLKIKDVGFGYDSLRKLDNFIYGECTIYSEDDGEEYADDFTFMYDPTPDEEVVQIDMPDDPWGEYVELIESILIDNLKTNMID